MSATEPILVESSEPPPAELVEVGLYPTSKDGFDRSLVVLALGWSCWLVPAETGFRLLVEPDAYAPMREQLERYERENVDWPPRPLEETTSRRNGGGFLVLLWTLLLLASYWAQDAWPWWSKRGALDTEAVFRHGEIWRPLTALFLHADAGHLVANAVSGAAVFAAVLAGFGRWRGWLLLAVSAIAGNFAAAGLNYPGPYRSIGASTGVFAALGLLTGRSIRRAFNSTHPHRWRGIFVSLATGLTVLGLYGAGGVEIDVLAHTTGFVAGLVVGFAAGEPTS